MTAPSEEKILLEVTPAELHLIGEAIDSHIYWQLSDEGYRNSGYVLEPGSDDPEKAKQIIDAEAFVSRLEAKGYVSDG